MKCFEKLVLHALDELDAKEFVKVESELQKSPDLVKQVNNFRCMDNLLACAFALFDPVNRPVPMVEAAVTEAPPHRD